MAHYQITLDSSTLHQLFLGGSADPGMKPMLESILNQVLQAQATEQVAAGPVNANDKMQKNGD